ncbi:MAG: DUF1669 domain-containing protein, partial [Elusimicrobia bacterium]|nr:DUF1669 domain-containing protein [Elusimicrobiota bacterium]
MIVKRFLSPALVASLLLPQAAWVQQTRQPAKTPSTNAITPLRPIASVPTLLAPSSNFWPSAVSARAQNSTFAPLFSFRSRAVPPSPSRGLSFKQPSTRRDDLSLAAQALSGTAEAGTLRPGLARLGSTAARFDPAAVSHSGMREAASIEFSRRANQAGETSSVALNFPQEPPQPAAADTAGAKSGSKKRRGGGGDGGRSDDPKAPKRAPKYPARDIDLNGKATLPSTALLPDRPIEPLIVEAIDATNETILVAAYEFKSREILKALRRARERGVRIQVILDFDHVFPVKWKDSDYVPARSIEIQSLLNERFDVQILRGMWRYGIMHNKFMVFDGKVAEFGSYNYTWTTENHHFENAKFTNDAKHVAALAAFWNYMREHSVAFDQARGHLWPESLPPPPADPTPSVRLHDILLPTFFFSPGGSGEDWIVKAIEAARESIDVSAFMLDSTRIARALAAARARRVRVRVILDRSQFESEGHDLVKTYGEWLAYHGIAVSLRAGPDPDGPKMFQKNHNKFMVIDGAVVETGSINWTKNASLMNFENGHFTDDATDVKAYGMFFEDLYAKASPVEAPEIEPKLLTDEELEEMLR